VTELGCIPTAGSGPTSIVVGPDGRLWFTETGAGKIARVSVP
jgi:virginiamycin B lyase